MRLAVVGHVEWVEFALVERVPGRGEIAHARGSFAEPAGGGAVAAVQLARLGGECTLYTALGEDDLADSAVERLDQLGVRVEAAIRTGQPTRRAFSFLDDDAERTITTLGERLQPLSSDPLAWDELGRADGVYFCAGDGGALRAARRAHALVAATRAGAVLERSGVPLDIVIGSARDPSERYHPLEPKPRWVVETDGRRGGAWHGAGCDSGEWAAAPVPGPAVDAYGCGDTFAAGLTCALAAQSPIQEALEFASRAGAACLAGRGPYGAELECYPRA